MPRLSAFSTTFLCARDQLVRLAQPRRNVPGPMPTPVMPAKAGTQTMARNLALDAGGIPSLRRDDGGGLVLERERERSPPSRASKQPGLEPGAGPIHRRPLSQLYCPLEGRVIRSTRRRGAPTMCPDPTIAAPEPQSAFYRAGKASSGRSAGLRLRRPRDLCRRWHRP